MRGQQTRASAIRLSTRFDTSWNWLATSSETNSAHAAMNRSLYYPGFILGFSSFTIPNDVLRTYHTNLT